MSDFKRIHERIDRSERRKRINDHLELVEEISVENDGRFTFTPLSLYLIDDSMKELPVPTDIQKTSVGFDKLSSAKASSSYFDNSGMMAIESMGELMSDLGTGSMMRALIELLERGSLDLTMRMFDKSQVGGNREISILNAIFRVAQSMVEEFFKKMGKTTGIDLLDDSFKLKTVADAASSFMKKKSCVFITADQTRWGPNFNTSLFGCLALMLRSKTTEYYIPALICFLSEMKIFEIPELMPEFNDVKKTGYSLPGIIGRSHMGQGIFHYASSFYHSMVLKTIQDAHLELFNPVNVISSISSYCTSDDVAMLCYTKPKDETNIKSIIAANDFRGKLYLTFRTSLKYFGIKTSNYKNIVSNKEMEFNSIYLSREAIGSNELKFLYSLVQPNTSGNLYRDMINIFSCFDMSVNSGCSRLVGRVIAQCNFVVKMRQWNCKINLTGIPSDEIIESGIELLEPKKDDDDDDRLRFETNVHFKRRDRVKNSNFESSYDFLKIKRDVLVEGMLNTRKPETFKSMLTYSKSDEVVLPDCYYKRELRGANSMSREVFIKELFSRTNSLFFLKSKSQSTSISLTSNQMTDQNIFTSKVLKQRPKLDFDSLSFVVSLYNEVPEIESVFDEEFTLHILRHNRRYKISDEKIEEWKTMTFRESIIEANRLSDELRMSAPNVVELVFNPEEKKIPYTRLIRTWDARSKTYSRSFNMTSVSNNDLLDENYFYLNEDEIPVYRYRFDQSLNPPIKLLDDYLNLRRTPKLITDRVEVSCPDLIDSAEIIEALSVNEIKYMRRNGKKAYLNVALGIKDYDDASSVVTSLFSQDFVSADTFMDKYKRKRGVKDTGVQRDWVSVELSDEYLPFSSSYLVLRYCYALILEELKRLKCVKYSSLQEVLAGGSFLSFDRNTVDCLNYLSSEMQAEINSDPFKFAPSSGILRTVLLSEKPFVSVSLLSNIKMPHFISIVPNGKVVKKTDLSNMIINDEIFDMTIKDRVQELKVTLPKIKMKQKEDEMPEIKEEELNIFKMSDNTRSQLELMTDDLINNLSDSDEEY